jgi:hypothetical protein
MDMNTLKDMGRDMSNFNKRDVLNALGLDTKESTTESLMPMLGIFAAGLLTGIGAGLLLAPKSGSEMRSEIADRATDAKNRAKETAEEHIPAH